MNLGEIKLYVTESAADLLEETVTLSETLHDLHLEKYISGLERIETPKPEEKNYMPIYSQEELDALDAEEEEYEDDSYDYDEYDDDSYYN